MASTQNDIAVRTASGSAVVTLVDQGEGHPFLLLHGGAGPQSVGTFADLLSAGRPARVLTPTHPGFAGTPRPGHLAGIRGLAALYVALLETLELTDVTVIGNSIGGWIAAELALIGSPRISSVVLVDAVGLQVDTHPIVDFFSLTLDQVADLSYYEPDKYRLDATTIPEPARTAMAGNRAALLAYGGTTMSDPTLLGRLAGITLPTLVIWGAADRIVEPEHGRIYAAEIPGARLNLIDTAGHLPQLETPQRLVTDVWDFADAHATNRPDRA